MKTLEIPEALLQQVESAAAKRGIPVRDFVAAAIEQKLNDDLRQQKPWMKLSGGLSHLREETARINQLIEEEFEQIEPEDRR